VERTERQKQWLNFLEKPEIKFLLPEALFYWQWHSHRGYKKEKMATTISENAEKFATVMSSQLMLTTTTTVVQST